MTANRKKRVVVAMSGGVDSALSAYLLQKEGYDVMGLYMRNWSEFEEGYCSGQDDMEQIDKVAKFLKMEWRVIDFQKEYWNHVFEPSLDQFAAGATPNPDVLCNREIKFKRMSDYIFEHFKDTDLIATGHYARLRPSVASPGKVDLLRSVDESKDQTYFLIQIPQNVLSRTLFPVGHLLKKDVKRIAAEVGLPNAARKESMGLCFIGKRRFDEFLGQYIESPPPGDFVDVDTHKIIGKHRGIPFYTLGQSASISGQQIKYFVASKDLESNRIYVCSSWEHPALMSSSLTTNEFHWISYIPEELKHGGTFRAHYRIRHRGDLEWCTISALPGSDTHIPTSILVEFDKPCRAVTPGQYVALYDGDVCLGGGPIARPSN